MSPIDLSVIIVSYNAEQEVSDCLRSVRTHNDIGSRLEVIVIEQSPDADIASRLEDEFSEFHVVRHPNRGFGAGNNHGTRLAQGRFLLFLNPDTLLVEPVFSFAVETFERLPRLGLFGVRLLDVNGRHNQSFYFRDTIGLTQGIRWRLLDRFDVFLPDKMYITGADMFVRRSAFLEAGMFDERMFLYLEEVDLCSRLQRSGYDISYFPAKRVIHLEGRSIMKDEAFGHRLESMRVLSEKNGWNHAQLLRRWRRTLMLKRLCWPFTPGLGMQLRRVQDEMDLGSLDPRRQQP